VYLSYGFEAITDRAARDEVMSRTLAFFAQPPTTHYYRFDHAPDPLIGPAGSLVTGTFDLYNFDEVATTTFSVAMSGAWRAAISPTLVTVAPCTSQHFTLTADIPVDTPFGESQPSLFQPLQSAWQVRPFRRRCWSAPGVWLVDDDRYMRLMEPIAAP
jgi:hypothetical protein